MEKPNDLDLNELKWDHDGRYWYSRDTYNITPADMHEYARKLEADNAALRSGRWKGYGKQSMVNIVIVNWLAQTSFQAHMNLLVAIEL